jgi:hypothetical protein
MRVVNYKLLSNEYARHAIAAICRSYMDNIDTKRFCEKFCFSAHRSLKRAYDERAHQTIGDNATQ